MSKPIVILSVVVASALAGLGIVSLRVPIRAFPRQPSLVREPLVEINPDATIKHLIRRAQLENYIFPITRLGRRLTFLRAATVPPNDAYLIFWAGDTDVTVRYRCSLEDRRLLWKAVFSE